MVVPLGQQATQRLDQKTREARASRKTQADTFVEMAEFWNALS